MTQSPAPPHISVVTVCLNAAKTIERTIDSVLAQNYPKLDYLVLDGGSTDGTLDILRGYGDRITFVSEPDQGMYDAMNKGIRRARGSWIHLLNADDWYVSADAIARAVPHLDPARTTYFDLIRSYPDGSEILQSRTVSPWMLHVSAFIPHPSLIVSREQYDQIGMYDPSLKIASDHDLILRLVRRYPPKHVPIVLTKMDQGGISARALSTSLEEFTLVSMRHGMPAVAARTLKSLKSAWWRWRSHA